METAEQPKVGRIAGNALLAKQENGLRIISILMRKRVVENETTRRRTNPRDNQTVTLEGVEVILRILEKDPFMTSIRSEVEREARSRARQKLCASRKAGQARRRSSG